MFFLCRKKKNIFIWILSSAQISVKEEFLICLFLLRFYGPVNPVGSCREWSVYLTTLLLGRLSPLSCEQVLCTFFCQKLTNALLESEKG